MSWAREIKAGNQAYERWQAGASVQDLEVAIDHYQRAAQAAATQESIANPKSDHPRIAAENFTTALKNLGASYMDLDRLTEAEASYRRALSVREGDVVWQNRPTNADIAHDLATVYRWQGRTDEALALYERAARVYERLDMKPRVAMTYHSLGHLREAQGELAEAQRVSAKALVLVQDGFGADATPKHPAYPILIHYTKHHAAILRKAGRVEEASAYDATADRMLRQLDDYTASLRGEGRDAEAKKIERRLDHR